MSPLISSSVFVVVRVTSWLWEGGSGNDCVSVLQLITNGGIKVRNLAGEVKVIHGKIVRAVPRSPTGLQRRNHEKCVFVVDGLAI